MFTYTLYFLGSLSYSIIIETIAIAILIRLVWKQLDKSWSQIITAGLFATLATIPYVWYVFPILFYQSSLVPLILGEIFAVIVETFVYAFWLRQPIWQAFILALIANIVSYYTGQLINPSQFFTNL